MTVPAATVDWLLDSDPALRWQVERDILGAPPEVWEQTRARVATEGWGARLLALQDPDGQWAGGAFFPGGVAFANSPERREPGQPWVATTWVLKDLREWGLDAAVLAGTAEKLAANSRWEYEDLPYWHGEIDVCINSYTLATGAWLGADVAGIARWFVEHRLDDGGWNCEAEEGDSARLDPAPERRRRRRARRHRTRGRNRRGHGDRAAPREQVERSDLLLGR